MKAHRISVKGKLLSTNAERKLHHMPRSEATKQWRSDAYFEAKAAHLPKLERVSIIVSPFQHRSVLQDAGNCAPVAKAVIDGLVDAGVLVDDDPEHVVSITFLAPKRVEGTGTDWVTIELIEAAK
jgi:crossover junction endodeoxyribonuclease RusA